MTRALPWTELISAIGVEQFVRIQQALAARGVNDLDRDAFLLDGTVGTLLHDLMPEDAPADAVNAWGALLHMMYVCWARDWPVVRVDAGRLRAAVPSHSPTLPLSHSPTFPAVCYIQLAPQLVWAEPVSGEPHEPLDGVFVVARADRVHVLGVLGFRVERDGFTTMEAAIRLPAPPPGAREDGGAAFASTLPGGSKAGLISVVDEHELSALALFALQAAGG
jgi:hypothetical protein